MKLTKAQRRILSNAQYGDLVNADEVSPSWWIEGAGWVNARAARRLARTPYVQFYKHEGGQPGVDWYRITPAGREALKEQP